MVNPCALGSAVAIPVRLINAGQAIGGTINAGENIANGNYWEAGFDLVGVAGNASQVFRPCFAAGTPVRTATGSILTENLKVGDIVLSRNEFDPEGQVDGKIVEDVFVRSAPIQKVVVQGRIIRTTAEHPFWVDGKGWTAAGKLKTGDNLLTANKSKLPVESVFETGDTETVYNFRVADWHTYFAGNENWDFEVWVHNACKVPGSNGPKNQAPGGVAGATDNIAEGSFSITEHGWRGYPEGLPRPQGPFRIIEGAEYEAARKAANQANQTIRKADPGSLIGKEIYEIQPVKFGGSPTDPTNKISLPANIHRQDVTPWWNRYRTSLQDNSGSP